MHLSESFEERAAHNLAVGYQRLLAKLLEKLQHCFGVFIDDFALTTESRIASTALI